MPHRAPSLPPPLQTLPPSSSVSPCCPVHRITPPPPPPPRVPPVKRRGLAWQDDQLCVLDCVCVLTSHP